MGLVKKDEIIYHFENPKNVDMNAGKKEKYPYEKPWSSLYLHYLDILNSVPFYPLRGEKIKEKCKLFLKNADIKVNFVYELDLDFLKREQNGFYLFNMLA